MIFTKRMNKEITCCFSGPGTKGLPYDIAGDNRCANGLKRTMGEQLENMVRSFHVTRFLSGVDLGTEQYACEMILDLKKEYSRVRLECVIPYELQAAHWTERQRDRYYSIIERCDKETGIQSHYTSDCRKNKDEYMLRQSDFLLAVWDGKRRRTATVVSAARARGLRVITINPLTLEVSPNLHII